MRPGTRSLSGRGVRFGATLALSACGAQADESGLERDRMPVTIEPSEEWSESFVAPEYTEAVCRSDWPFISVAGPACAARETLTCGEGRTLQATLESIASSCGLSDDDGPVELLLQGGCVTSMACGPSTLAQNPSLLDCLAAALGSVQAACNEQPECVRLFAGGAIPAE
jgi:hypothetical protein